MARLNQLLHFASILRLSHDQFGITLKQWQLGGGVWGFARGSELTVVTNNHNLVMLEYFGIKGHSRSPVRIQAFNSLA